MDKRIPYYRIEAYLAGVLSDDERVSFEIEMGEDAVLAEVVVEQRGIVFGKSFGEVFSGGWVC